MNVKLVLPKERVELPNWCFHEKNKSRLIEAIYYDSDWWQKNIATEWWRRNGHFNETIYQNYLLAKLDSINNLILNGQG
jgi:hypothetical protein